MMAFLVWKSRFICGQTEGEREHRHERDGSLLCYLFGSLVFDELLVNAAGPGRQVLLGGVHAEILAGRPELDVLLAELRFEEDAEGGFSVCGRGDEQFERQVAVCLLAQGGISRAPLRRGRFMEAFRLRPLMRDL